MTDWPLFWCLKPEKRIILIKWYWDNYGEKLSIPPKPKEITLKASLESPEKIDREMRKPPEKMVRVK